MNFLNFLTAGASLFNFNLQNLASSSALQVTPSSQKRDEEGLSLTPEVTAKIKQEMEVLSQQQHLINQYMSLNIQLLSQKLENLQKTPVQQKPKSPINKEQISEQLKNARKKNKKINKCGHDDKQHYAKGLCNNCYHKYGRTKKPWNCPHDKLYAAGMCQNCYINNYNRKKRLTRDENPGSQQELELKIEQSHYQQSEQEQKQENSKHEG